MKTGKYSKEEIAMSERTIRVTGKGKLKVRPDMTRITMTLEGIRKDYAKAIKASSEDTEALKELLEKEDFSRENVKTLSFDVDIENESYKDKDGNWKSKCKGYKYCHMMKIEFPSDQQRLGNILYLLANNTAIRPEFRFSFFVGDAEASKNELLGKAVADAKEKAAVLADAAGCTLKNIVSIDYSWGEIELEISPMKSNMLQEAVCVSEGCYTMDIEPDDIEMCDTVTIVWGIE